ncbi:MAG TPA: hypothetical protein DEQ43_10765 [Nocardioides bacterium]|uniref:hypothetical protein n=1 Tax=uncultured Nocardioides sp. TaxID=198441 RepID=UPI000EE953F7|nr:hypothetical protein [uncultured Nocardioides sp.]HCB04709.1 hypothetical protein [Nocardioides sp.]
MNETRGRLLLRAVVLVAPVLALEAARPDDVPHRWFVALTLALAVGFAAMPESPFGTACLGLVVIWWALASANGVPVGAIPAALLLLAAHVAAVLLAYGPPGLPIGTPVLLLWLRRGAVVAVAVPLLWLLAVAVDGQPEPPGIWVAGLGCAIVICVVAATAVSTGQEKA